MLRRRAGRPGGEDTSKQHEISFVVDHGRAGAISPAVASPPPKLLLASSPERGQPVVMSPTSILQSAAVSPTSPADTCSGSGTAVPFSLTGGGCSRERRSKSQRPWEAKPVGLGLVGALNREAPDDVPCALTVVTGKIKPCFPPSKVLGVVKSSRTGTAGAPALAAHPSPARCRCLSPREMAASEDYTRVIARGPNPRTTQIFDNRVVDTRGCFWFSTERAAAAAGGCMDDFLRRCHGCSKELGQGKDIFMYRGERAFCSRECRYREMLYDNGTEF